MTKALTYLGLVVRLLCSFILLLLLAIYVQTGNLNIGPEAYQQAVEQSDPSSLFSMWNWVSIAAIAIVILTLLRVMNLVWNVAFNASVLFFLCLVSWGDLCGWLTPIADMMNRIGLTGIENAALEIYPVPVILVLCIFVLGWFAGSASFRIALNAAICFILWVGLTLLADSAIGLWASRAGTPTPDGLAMLLANPWIPAAVIGAFFAIYSTLVAALETFTCRSRKKAAEPEQAEEEKAPAEPEASAPAEEKKPEAAPLPPVPAAKAPEAAKPDETPKAEGPAEEKKPDTADKAE